MEAAEHVRGLILKQMKRYNLTNARLHAANRKQVLVE